MSHALDLVGERWALLVVRELLLGPRRFTDLHATLPGASTNILTRRLRELEEVGVLEKYKAGAPVSSNVYRLTPLGQGLEPVVFALGAWGVQSPCWDMWAPSSADSLVLALVNRTSAMGGVQPGLMGTCTIVLEDNQTFTLHFDGSRLDAARGEVRNPDLVVETSIGTLKKLVNGATTVVAEQDSGQMKLVGDERLFNSLFVLPGALVAD